MGEVSLTIKDVGIQSSFVQVQSHMETSLFL
jgi:hypothetical protein